VLQLAPGVLVAQSRFWATNTIAVQAGQCVLLIDPGVHLDELRAVAAGLPAPTAAVHTHAHWDHVLWCRELGELVPRFVTAGTAAYLAGRRAEVLTEVDAHAEGHDDEQLLALGEALADGADVPWTGPAALLIETAAHLPGHGTLHLPELGLLVAGDLVSDVDVPFPHWSEEVGADTHAREYAGPDGLPAYRAGLDCIAHLQPVTLVIPGHGAPTDRAGFLARLDDDRRYLDALEQAVRSASSAADAVERADRIPDRRLANPAVRRAHQDSALSLFRRLADW
jgi:glyoxylase-like metal-dependent hydrolase (beta-lactamase superfamily II)